MKETPEMRIKSLQTIENSKPCPEHLKPKHSVFDKIQNIFDSMTEEEKEKRMIRITRAFGGFY